MEDFGGRFGTSLLFLVSIGLIFGIPIGGLVFFSIGDQGPEIMALIETFAKEIDQESQDFIETQFALQTLLENDEGRISQAILSIISVLILYFLAANAFFFTFTPVVIDGARGLRAFGRSAEISAGYRGKIILIALAMSLIIGATSIILTVFISRLALPPIGFEILFSCVRGPLAAFGGIFVAVTYTQLLTIRK